GPSRSPANLATWGFEKIGDGKNSHVAINPATGDVYAVWENFGIFGRHWTPGLGWGPVMPLADGALPSVAVTPDGFVHVVYVTGSDVVYDRFDGNLNNAGGHTRVSSCNAAHWPQVVGDQLNRIHIAFSQGCGGPWEIYYAKRDANGVWDNGGGIERVSRDFGVLDRYPTIRVDANGNPSIAWSGDDDGNEPRIYERTRGADNNPWPDYSPPQNAVDPNPNLAEVARYGDSLSHANLLSYVRTNGSGTPEAAVFRSLTGGIVTIEPDSAKWVSTVQAPSDGNIYALVSVLNGDQLDLKLYLGGTTGASWTFVGTVNEFGPPPIIDPPPPWTPWASQGGILTDSPAAAGFNGRAYVFAKGSDNALYVNSSDTAGQFTTWRSLGGILTAAPAAASFNGRLYAFAKGSDNALYVTSSADGVSWSTWGSQGGILLAPPAAASANGRLYVFAMGTDKALYVKSTADGINWTPWASLGGVLTAAPAAAGFNGQIFAFAKGTDNALYVRSSVDGVNWVPWQSLGGVLVAAPAAAVSGNGGTLYTFASGTGGFAYERHMAAGGAWTQWVSLGGRVVGPPAAASIPNGPLFVFVRWTDNALWDTHNP
ncbi:MAG TPA: hypothetical protein VFW96_10265, partial [Thermomicrobiales bacterium]|nr:hypothetical protein [Thermomicrobiales bacterium]